MPPPVANPFADGVINCQQALAGPSRPQGFVPTLFRVCFGHLDGYGASGRGIKRQGFMTIVTDFGVSREYRGPV